MLLAGARTPMLLSGKRTVFPLLVVYKAGVRLYSYNQLQRGQYSFSSPQWP